MKLGRFLLYVFEDQVNRNFSTRFPLSEKAVTENQFSLTFWTTLYLQNNVRIILNSCSDLVKCITLAQTSHDPERPIQQNSKPIEQVRGADQYLTSAYHAPFQQSLA